MLQVMRLSLFSISTWVSRGSDSSIVLSHFSVFSPVTYLKENTWIINAHILCKHFLNCFRCSRSVDLIHNTQKIWQSVVRSYQICRVLRSFCIKLYPEAFWHFCSPFKYLLLWNQNFDQVSSLWSYFLLFCLKRSGTSSTSVMSYVLLSIYSWNIVNNLLVKYMQSFLSENCKRDIFLLLLLPLHHEMCLKQFYM
jgi:hypothetical protein